MAGEVSVIFHRFERVPINGKSPCNSPIYESDDNVFVALWPSRSGRHVLDDYGHMLTPIP